MKNKKPGDYPVGYGRPPIAGRFQKGRSGNPGGRKRGAETLVRLLDQALSKPVVVTIKGRRRKIPKRTALVELLVNAALSGDPRMMKLLLDFEYKIRQQAPAENQSPITLELFAEMRQRYDDMQAKKKPQLPIRPQTS
jgi:hypothetical protein